MRRHTDTVAQFLVCHERSVAESPGWTLAIIAGSNGFSRLQVAPALSITRITPFGEWPPRRYNGSTALSVHLSIGRHEGWAGDEPMRTYLFTTLPTNDLGLLTRSLPIARELAGRGHRVIFCNPAAAGQLPARGFLAWVGHGRPL
jgi:hypothetical protein